MLFSEASKLLEPGYFPLETGYYRLTDGQILVATLTRMPRCKGEMINWWFAYMDNSEKYRMWCPEDHLDLEVCEDHQEGLDVKTCLLVTRKVGGAIRKSQIRHHVPSDFLNGFDPNKTPDIAVISANVYTPEKVLESRVIHCARDTDYGCEMRSRHWLLNATDDLAMDVMRHGLEEMGNLADFLPDLFNQQEGNTMNSQRAG